MNYPNYIANLKAQKDNAYWERDQLVAALSKVYPAHLAWHPEDDKSWEDDWRNIVCVHLPTGQATWHIHDREVPWFDHLVRLPAHWDGHTTEEKYDRLAAIQISAARYERLETIHSTRTQSAKDRHQEKTQGCHIDGVQVHRTGVAAIALYSP
jgi:hypothetical protein